MKIVTLYKWENLSPSPLQSRFGYVIDTMDIHCVNTVLLDDGNEYALPQGYTLSEDMGGKLRVYDNKDQQCEIQHAYGKPSLVSTAIVHLEVSK